MSLEPCVECRREISTEAKTCPNCGARNRAYKSKTGKYWLNAAMFGVVGFFIFAYISHEEHVENITNCDTPGNRDSFVSVINGSSYVQLNKLRVIDITNIKTIKSGNSITDLACEATIDFNSRKKSKYRFTWRESESGFLIIQANEK